MFGNADLSDRDAAIRAHCPLRTMRPFFVRLAFARDREAKEKGEDEMKRTKRRLLAALCAAGRGARAKPLQALLSPHFFVLRQKKRE